MSIIDTLVFDRTNQDLYEYQRLNSLPFTLMTDNEKAKWLSGTIKGAYNVSDINRVNAAVNYLHQKLYDASYKTEVITQDVDINDTPNIEYFERYLLNVKNIRDIYYVLSNTPQLPTNVEDIKTIIGANAIEKTLYDINSIFEKMLPAYRKCGTFNSGGMEGLI